MIDMTDDTDRRVDDLRARLQELNGRLAVPQIEPKEPLNKSVSTRPRDDL